MQDEEHEGTNYTVEDMGSMNGTYIDRKKLQPHSPQTIKPGDELRLGKLSRKLQECSEPGENLTLRR